MSMRIVAIEERRREIKNTVIKAKQVAAQLQLMAGQLDHLTNHILTEVRNEI